MFWQPNEDPGMPATSKKTDAVTKTFEIEFDQYVGPAVMRAGLIKNGRIPNVELPMEFASATCAEYVAAIPEMLAKARFAAAEMLLDRSTFPNAAQFNEAARILAREINPVGASIAGGEGLKRYAIGATYHGDGGPFGDTAMAHDEAEAEFQIRWTMTENAGYRAANDALQFAQVMAKHRIRDIEIETVSFSTKTLLADLVREAQASGHSGPALDAAREAAAAMGLDVAPPSPKI
jgi:hypothetical protein